MADTGRALANGSIESTDSLMGTTIQGRYRVEAELGEGGSSTIYRGVHTAIGRTVAIKVLRSDLMQLPGMARRFMHEGRAVSCVHHEHVVEALDFGVTRDRRVFLVMEHLHGETLADLVDREGPLPWPRARAIALQICGAMQAAHDAGVIHRDLTLGNCFRIHREHNPDYVKVIDFGIAKIAAYESAFVDTAGRTEQSIIFGTPEYMAPEQARRLSDADARSDIYALGVMIYGLVTGRLPFRGATALDTLVKQVYEAPKPPSSLVPTLPPQLDAVLAKALHKTPAARFQRMSELADALAAIAGLAVVGTASVRSRAVVGTQELQPWAEALDDCGGDSNEVAEKAAAPRATRRAVLAIAGCMLLVVGLGAGLPSLRGLASSTWRGWFPDEVPPVATPNPRRESPPVRPPARKIADGPIKRP